MVSSSMVLKKHITFILFFVFIGLSVQAQKTKIYTDQYADYRDGLELFDKQKFAAAQEKFKNVIELMDNKHDEIQVSAEYLRASCALELFNIDAHF